MSAQVACTLAPGDGPRHAAWHPSLNVLYVLCELSCRVVAFAVDRRTGRSLDKEPLAAARTLPPECYGGRATGPPTEPKSTCAALVVHPNGKWLYCSNRRRARAESRASGPPRRRRETTRSRRSRGGAARPGADCVAAAAS